jgi:predicted acylesterase/phospholipase RssA
MLGATPNEAPLKAALVLSGGGALGSYEAGVIGCWVDARGIKDHTPLRPYQMVFGTSIGSLNGWMVASGQYTRLRQLWYSVSAAHLMRLKPEFAASENPNSGVLDRVAAKIHMGSLATDQTALYDSKPVLDFISREIDPERPLVIPFVWAVTNMTENRTEFFYRRARSTPAQFKGAIVHAIQSAMGPQTVVREANVMLLHKQLFASAAIPIVWDPVQLPGPEGSINDYCDGGVMSNSSVRISHAVASAVDVILLRPPLQPVRRYANAIAIAFGMVGAMQQKILEIDMRTVHYQSELAKCQNIYTPTKLSYIRPKATLPISSEDFDNEEGIGKAYQIGWNDAIAGLTPYDFTTYQ